MMPENWPWVILFVQLALGSGLFILLLRLTFLLGQYTQRVTHLETTIDKLEKMLDAFQRDFADYRAGRVFRQGGQGNR